MPVKMMNNTLGAAEKGWFYSLEVIPVPSNFSPEETRQETA
jgi:hypothetical protein